METFRLGVCSGRKGLMKYIALHSLNSAGHFPSTDTTILVC